MLTPEIIKQKVFEKCLRGYDTAAVDKFLEEVRKEFEYLYLDNVNLKQTIERVTSKLEYYQQMETTMQSTLSVAQETADEVRTNSLKQAELLDKETQDKCKQCLISAENEAQRLVDEATEKASELYSQIKIRTDNLKRASELECQRMRDDADAYVTELRTTVEKETGELKASTEAICKKTTEDTLAESKKLMEDTRTKVHEMMMEANDNYRKIVGDAEERSSKLIFDAENRVAVARIDYDNLIRKTNAFKKNMNYMLKNQLEFLGAFAADEPAELAEGGVEEGVESK